MKLSSILASAAMIVAAASVASADPFADVPTNHWAYEAVNSIAAKGIIEGFPGGVFKGKEPVTRYQLAMITAKLIANIEQMGGAGALTKADLQSVENLTVEFADELSLLGVKVTALEDDMQVVKEDVATLKQDVEGIKTTFKEGGLEKVKLSGDILVRHTVGKEKGDTNKSNDSRTSTQLRLKMDAQVDENIKAVARWNMVDDKNYLNGNSGETGAAWNGSNHKTGDVDVAYLQIKNMFRFGGDFTFGRRFMTHGHALLINDEVDAVTYNKRSGDVDISFNVIFDRRNTPVKGADYRNVWNVNFDTNYKGHNIYAGIYGNSIELTNEAKTALKTKNNEKRYDVEIGSKGVLGNNGHWSYDIAGVYSQLKEADKNGMMAHGAISWDSKKEWAAKAAYTMIDEKSAGARYVSYDRRYDDEQENPLEDIVRGSVNTGYARCDASGNNIQDIKVQMEYRPRKDDRHYLRLAYDMVSPKDKNKSSMFFQGGKGNSEKANVITAEYRYRLADNTRFGLGYTNFQFDDGNDVNHAANAVHSRDYDLLWTELYSQF